MRRQAKQYKAEFFSCGETVINGSNRWDQMRSYKDWLAYIEQTAQQETSYLALYGRGEEPQKDLMVGMLHLRFTEGEVTQKFGHIGYSVRPTQRCKGYASEMLHLILQEARRHGLPAVELHCYEDNVASQKTMLRNGGFLIARYRYENSPAVKYRIIL